MILTPEAIFSFSSIIPVLVIKKLEYALPIARALKAGGARVIEITLRTPVALEAIKQLRMELPDVVIGAGTVTNIRQLECAREVGAQFAISPGFTPTLLQAGIAENIPLFPGVSSISELMQGIELGYQLFKLFPAQLVGGIELLKTIHAVFPLVSFCPTGGINETNFLDYLKLPNVRCVGGTWMVPEVLIENKNWFKITELCSNAFMQIEASI